MKFTATITAQHVSVEIGDAFDANGYVTFSMPDAETAGLNMYELTMLHSHIGLLLEKRKNERTTRHPAVGSTQTG